MQEIVLTGNIGKEPEMKYFESGKCNVNFSIAVGRYDFQKRKRSPIGTTLLLGKS